MGAIGAFLIGPIGRWVLIVLAVWGWHAWRIHVAVESVRAEWRADVKKAENKRRDDIAGLVVDLSGRNTALADALRLSQSREAAAAAARKPELRNYVTAKADAGCIVTSGFVLEHEAAWRGSGLPPAPGESVDAPSGVPLSEVAAVDDDNATACRIIRDEALTWREWYATVSARWAEFVEGTRRK